MNSSLHRFLLSALLCSFVPLLGACDADDTEIDSAGDDTVATTVTDEKESVPSVPGDAIGVITTPMGKPLPSDDAIDFTLVSHTAPQFSWQTGAGEKGSLADYRGKVVMLNFWATWCGPCLRELPDIVQLRNELSPKGFEVLGISVSEQPPDGLTLENYLGLFAKQEGVTYPILVADEALTAMYGGIQGIPTTFIVDRDGRVVRKFVGAMPGAEFRSAVEAVL